ncbi:hypothetical protein EXIGLDRAFT_755854 [Exidia glandulosa HHB12029]|uniref:Uncharacterized protein n=1 Tax=Exidia glandulosa HHB12029 TaxID=1314781 RepID=A0A165BQ82_EXIGL|nr:hypothetical protein EXIGLDRAFT_755854 [Exidia glandulosa HHB12029]
MGKISTKSNKQNVPPATSTRTLRPRKSLASDARTPPAPVQRFAPYPKLKITFKASEPQPLQVDYTNHDLVPVDHTTPAPAPGWPSLRFASPAPAPEVDVREPGPEGATEMERVLPSIAMILAS